MTMSSITTAAEKQLGLKHFRPKTFLMIFLRLFRRRDGTQIANYRVSADLKCLDTTADGKSVGGKIRINGSFKKYCFFIF